MWVHDLNIKMNHKRIQLLFRYKIGTILFYFSWIRWFYLNEKKQQKWSSPQAICSTYIVPYARDKLAKLRLSRPDRSPITRPNRRRRPDSGLTEGSIGRRRVSVLKNRHRRVEWQVCFSKTGATQTRPELYKKSGQTCKIKPDPPRFRPDLARSQPVRLDLVGFSQIRPIPAIFREKFQISAKKNADPGMIFQIPEIFFRFRRRFFSRFRWFFTPATDRTDRCSPSPETDSTDFSGGWFRVSPPATRRRRVEPQTDPTRPVDSPLCSTW